MGVLQGEDIKFGRFVAFKFLPDEVAKDPQAAADFSAKSQPPRPSIIPHLTVCEIDEQKSQAFIAMAFLDDVTPSVT
jgi:hypothetical protein